MVDEKLIYSFESSAWHEYLRRGEDPMPENLPLNGIRGAARFDWGPVDVEDEAMDDYKMVSWAIRQLENFQDSEKGDSLLCPLFDPARVGG